MPQIIQASKLTTNSFQLQHNTDSGDTVRKNPFMRDKINTHLLTYSNLLNETPANNLVFALTPV